MKVGTLKKVIAAYLQIPVEDTVVQGVDLALLALNNARRLAEQLHDWNCEEVMVYGDATDGVGIWSTMLNVEDDEEVQIKVPVTFYSNEGNDVLVPLYHHSRKGGAAKAKERIDRQHFTSSNWRYRSDEGIFRTYTIGNSFSYKFEVFLHGGGYELAPTPTGTNRIHVDGYKWLADYTEDTDEDFFTIHGSMFLQWAGIVELNNLFQVFVPQQEGTLPPPVKMRDDAFMTLKEYDSFIVETGRMPGKI